jgi:hypothetical protein
MAFLVTAMLLVRNAWFDVTTAVGTLGRRRGVPDPDRERISAGPSALPELLAIHSAPP